VGNASKQSNVMIRRALSHPTRRALLGYLIQTLSSGTNEVELADALDLTMPTVRYHLVVLRDSDLITQIGDRKPGVTARYVSTTSESP